MTDKNNFTGKQICEILKACAESGVKSLKLGDLVVEFIGKANSTEQDASYEPASPEEINKQIEEAEKLAAFELMNANKTFVEEEIANLQVSDPFEFEELVTQGALEDEEA